MKRVNLADLLAIGNRSQNIPMLQCSALPPTQLLIHRCCFLFSKTENISHTNIGISFSNEAIFDLSFIQASYIHKFGDENKGEAYMTPRSDSLITAESCDFAYGVR